MLGVLDGQRGETKDDSSLHQPDFGSDDKVFQDPVYQESMREAFFMEFPTFNSSHGAVEDKEDSQVSPAVQNGYVSQDSLNSEQAEWDAKERKRAQNRAAQKAFRERREARLKELEEKLKQSEKNRKELSEEIKILKEQNLRQNSTCSNDGLCDNAWQTYTFPTPNEFYDELVAKEVHGEFKVIKERYVDEAGKEILPIAAAWEYLHSLLDHKDFDIQAVMQSLKGREVCHGHGAAYPKALIDQAVENSLTR
ncbi:hypothetical protein HG537_0F02970 [Torulaspora globosa]|uniref:BZIP domain-containing protein n=1 Tax=Torulaspora globosa TaxID=48254 RepID=A0A7H9HXH6_9SACH|nr:hypothetical protein HG537_0F02970 [Torulaspora sp. CBS 2947]